MVISTPFKFKNKIRDYYLDTKNIQFGEPCEPYDVIVIAGEERIVDVYTDFSNHNALMDVLSVNVNDNQDIVKYLQKYGPFFRDPSTGTDIVGIEYEEIYVLNDVALTVITLQALARLMAAYMSEDVVEMMVYAITLLLSDEWPDDDVFHAFAGYFNQQCDRLHYFNLSRSESSALSLAQLIDLVYQLPEDERMDIWDYDTMYPQCMELLSLANKLFDMNLFQAKQLKPFKENVSDFLANLTKKNILLLKNVCAYIIESEMNYALYSIQPQIKVSVTGDIIGDWDIRDLYSALYLDMYLQYTSGNLLKHCANPTCSQYFEVPTSETRKIYCSPHCASLMAKRKQRERDKAKKESGE